MDTGLATPESHVRDLRDHPLSGRKRGLRRDPLGCSSESVRWSITMSDTRRRALQRCFAPSSSPLRPRSASYAKGPRRQRSVMTVKSPKLVVSCVSESMKMRNALTNASPDSNAPSNVLTRIGRPAPELNSGLAYVDRSSRSGGVPGESD
jgi:hypothetical protein